MKRILAGSVVLVLAVAACGGGSDDSPAADGDGETSTTQDAASGSSDQSTAPGDTDTSDTDTSEGSGPSTATVTIDGETFEYSSDGAIVAQCLTDLFGIFSVQLTAADGGDGGIQIMILHDGTDPVELDQVNSVSVGMEDDDWIADESSEWFESIDAFQPGMSQVDSAEIDGRTVSGTATFVRQNSLFTDTVETATGTFEATCGDERTS